MGVLRIVEKADDWFFRYWYCFNCALYTTGYDIMARIKSVVQGSVDDFIYVVPHYIGVCFHYGSQVTVPYHCPILHKVKEHNRSIRANH